jgi:hypothetical protein
MPNIPAFFLFISLGADDTGAVAAAFWRRSNTVHLSPLTLLDLTAASVADLDIWLIEQVDRLTALARELGLRVDPRLPTPAEAVASLAGIVPAPFVPTIFAPAAISAALAMRRLPAEPVPEAIEMMRPEQCAIRAAVYVTSGAVSFSPLAAEKAKSHPFNAITKSAVGMPAAAVATAFTLGVLLALAPAG